MTVSTAFRPAPLAYAIACAATLAPACGRLGFDSLANTVTDASIADGAAADSSSEIADLIAMYPMDGLIIGGIVPASTGAYIGACSDAECPTPIPGRIGGGYAFDAAQWIALPPALAARIGPAPFTIAVWAAPAPHACDSVLFAKSYSLTANTDVMSLLVLEGTRYLTFETTPDGAEYAYLPIAVNTDLEDSTWHHAAISWDGATKRIYLDGALVGITVATVATSDQPLLIGADLDGGAVVHAYVGALDDLRIYGRALRDAEIAVLAKVPDGANPPPAIHARPLAANPCSVSSRRNPR